VEFPFERGRPPRVREKRPIGDHSEVNKRNSFRVGKDGKVGGNFKKCLHKRKRGESHHKWISKSRSNKSIRKDPMGLKIRELKEGTNKDTITYGISWTEREGKEGPPNRD